jgi:GTP 3',8-cyclase
MDSCSKGMPRRSSPPACAASNVWIDSLQRDGFYEMTRRDALLQVLAGLRAFARLPEARPIKLNAVALRGFTDQEVRDRSKVLPGSEIREIISARWPLETLPRHPAATARVYPFADGRGTIGFIDPVTSRSAATATGSRLTAEGKLRTCLSSVHETDVRGQLRGGASDHGITQVIRDAVWGTELKHRVNEQGFVQPPRSMSAIGG